jgi:hypothetical protein
MTDTLMKCANCNEHSTSLFACARCQAVRYCGKSCQTQHWGKGGHKESCKRATNPDTGKRVEFLSLVREVVEAAKKNDSKKIAILLSKMDPHRFDEVIAYFPCLSLLYL